MSLGFDRIRQPQPLSRAAVVRFLVDELDFIRRSQDPFLVDDPCPVNPTGHQVIASCGEIVCSYCGRIFWR